jgi:AcrR family transcriptional regulator
VRKHPSTWTPTRRNALTDSDVADFDVIEQLREQSILEVELGPFPSRSALVAHVLEYIYQSEKVAEEEIATGPTDLDTYFDGIMAAFDWNADPDNAFLRRATFEAAAYESSLVQPHYQRWIDEASNDLQALGVSPTDAAIESRILNNMFLGYAYDLTVNHDADTTRAVFLIALGRFRERVVHLIELAV